MAEWVFFDFVERGENCIQTWINEDLAPSESTDVRTKLNTRLDYMAATAHWDERFVEMLSGDCDGLFEIKFRIRRIQYRPLACFGPGDQEVTLLMGAKEVNDRFRPLSACETAQRRKALIMSNRRYICPHER